MIVWALLMVAVLILRFTYFTGADVDRRIPLIIFAMGSTAVLFMAGTLYESRRLALLTGFRGRGTFGYLRGWLQTAFVEVAATDDQVPQQAYREYRAFRIWSGYAFAAMIVIVPILAF